MFASLRTFLTGLIDYAGLFPPARLPLDQALRNYARCRNEADSWMLGRFLCPAARLAELSPLSGDLFAAGPPLLLSALGRGGNTAEEFLTGLYADLQLIESFLERHGSRAKVEALEVRLPAGALKPGSPQTMAELLTQAHRSIEAEAPPALQLFYEAVPAGYAVLPQMLDSLRAAATGRKPGHAPAPGFKLRCGGVVAADFPTLEQVANVLIQCRDHGIALKATAGLHHPLRHFNTEVQTHMHGFVNVFGAGVLAHARRLDEGRVRQILAAEDAASFVFDDSGFRWNDLHATTAEIAAARQRAVLSFGSCSFDEPRADLRALGWLA